MLIYKGMSSGLKRDILLRNNYNNDSSVKHKL